MTQPQPDQQPALRYVQVMMTSDEYAAAFQAAHKVGVSIADYLRACVAEVRAQEDHGDATN